MLTSGATAKTLWLVALALLLTIGGVFLGATFALPIIASGWVFLLVLAELALIWTAPTWSRSSPLNIILFSLFPLLSGLTLTPVIISVLGGYANGFTILVNALIATTLLTASSAVFASMTRDLGASVGTILFQSVIGLLVFGILQMFFPALRSTVFETIISVLGIVTFSVFLSYDLQRLARRESGSPFLLAISLYLDIYNLFLYVLRFMLAVSGRRD